MDRVFPDKEWLEKPATELGFSEDKLDAISRWFEEKANGKDYRVVLVRDGYIAADWQKDIYTGRRSGTP